MIPVPVGAGRSTSNAACRRRPQAARTRLDASITDLHGKPKKRPEYPIGTVALYGPDDKTTTKIAAGVITSPTAEPIIRRWVATDVTTNPKVQREMKDFFAGHGVRSVAVSEGNMGCPHEEGEDFPEGTDCPFCPFWEGKQGSNRRDLRMSRFDGRMDESRGQTNPSRDHEPMNRIPDRLTLGKGSSFVKSRLSRLPRTEEVWEADIQPISVSGLGCTASWRTLARHGADPA